MKERLSKHERKIEKRLSKYERNMIAFVVRDLYHYALAVCSLPDGEKMNWQAFKNDYCGVKQYFCDLMLYVCGKTFVSKYKYTIKNILKKYIDSKFETYLEKLEQEEE